MNDTYFFGKRMSFNEGGRARFNVGGTGNKDAEALGFNYISDNKYLQDDFTGSTPLDFSNTPTSGIMTQAPIPRPLKYIPEGDGDGGKPPGPTDYGYTGLGSTGSKTGFNIDDIGEGTIDDEDIEEGGLGIVDGLRAMGAFIVGGPINAGYSLKKSVDRNKQKEIDKINADINTQYGYGTGAASQSDMDSYGVDKDTGNPGNYDQDYDMKDGGRAGYFFGGRVNYKAGGRTDAGANRSTASKAGVGQINEAGNKVDGGNYNDGGNDGGDIKPTLFNNPEIFDKKTIFGDMPTGIGFDNSYGRYKATLDLEKSLKEKALEGEIEYNNTVGDFNFGGKYDTKDGATYGVGYTGNNFDVNVNNQTGLSGGFSKDIGPGTLTASGTYDPITGEFNTEARYGISFGKGKKDGGRIGFKNGGLAGLL